MSQELPVGNCKWKDDIEHLDVMNVPDNSNEGYILEVDVDGFCCYVIHLFVLSVQLFFHHMIILGGK